MPKVLLGDVSRERKETCKGSKSGYPIVGLEHMVPEELTLTSWSDNSENTFSKVFHKGDVLFGRRRAYLKKAAVAPFDGICSGDITVIEANAERIVPELLPFIIQNDALFDYAVGKSAGSLSPRVKWEHLKNYKFELPDMNKQRELAELLWSIDEAKKAYQELIVATDELVKSQFIEMHSQYPRVKFKELFTTHARIGWQKLTQKEFLDEGEYYLVTGWDIMPDKTVAFSQCKYVTKERYEQDPKLILSKGDVLLTKDGTLGKVAIIGDMDKPATLNGHIFVIRPKDERMLPEFLLGILTSADFVDQMYRNKTGSTIVGITQKAILEFDVPLAPVEAQKEYILFARQSDKSKFELEQALSELNATYKRIIAENLG